MAFLPEDGTGVTGANSLVSVALADAYWADRSNATWAGKTTQQKQGALLEATAFLEGEYAGRWPGKILVTAQGLSWPRDDAYDRDKRELTGVPASVVSAVAELALLTFSGALAPSRDGSKRVKRQKAGSLEIEYETTKGSVGKSYPFIDTILANLLPGPSGSMTMALRRV